MISWRRKWKIFLFGFWCLMCAKHLTAQPVDCNEEALPKSARAALHLRFPRAHIVMLNDLDEDERSEWMARKSGSCPGLLHGTFGPNIEGYAISMTMPTGKFRSKETLVFLQERSRRYFVRVLSPTSEVTAHTNVLSIAPPGIYEAVESRMKTLTRSPMVIYEAIGAGSIGYFYHEGRWHSLPLSE